MPEKKPKWAWSSVDDPNPIFPVCDYCDAFALWAVARMENHQLLREFQWVTRAFACGRHLNSILICMGEDEMMVYDITQPPERG